MTMTTIKVSSRTRDRLKAQAAASNRSLGAYLEVLADRADREARFEMLRRAIAATPPELMASYEVELAAWESADLIDDVP